MTETQVDEQREHEKFFVEQMCMALRKLIGVEQVKEIKRIELVKREDTPTHTTYVFQGTLRVRAEESHRPVLARIKFLTAFGGSPRYAYELTVGFAQHLKTYGFAHQGGTSTLVEIN